MNRNVKKVSRVSRGAFILQKFSLPEFALQLHEIISSKYKHTYVVGGAIRNILLSEKVSDVDIATSATPSAVIALLKKAGIKYSIEHQKFGVVVAKQGKQKVEITTFRTELYGANRFPKVSFTASSKTDSNRRDFTINGLYLNPKTGVVLDFHNGQKDIKNRVLKFIGNSQKRIEQDPLRIVRAYRFQLQYKLKLEEKTARELKNNLHLLKKVSSIRLQREIKQVQTKKLQKQLQKVIHSNA